MRATLGFVLLWCALAVCAPAAAQDVESPPLDDEAAPAADEGDEAASAEESTEDEAGDEGADVAAPAARRAWSFGPYFRFVVVPAFMLNLFLDLAPSPANAAFGATATYQTEDGPSFDMGIGYTGYGFSGPFRKKGGEPGETEWVESDLGLVHLTGSILWEAKISEPLSFQYGIGLDVGIVTGELKRTEAYPKLGGGWAKCSGPQSPPGIYCLQPMTGPGLATDPSDKDGEQYNVVDKGVPPVFGLPMLPQLALRYTPIPELILRVQAAYGIAQFWFGLSAAYAPEL